MKKLIAGIVVMGVLSTGAYFVYDFLKTPYPEMVLPENTLAYFRINDMESLREDLNETVLWSHLSKSERKETYLRLWNRMLSSVESISGVDLNWMLEDMNGDVVLGIFPLQESVSMAFLMKTTDDDRMARVIEQKLDPVLKRRLEDLKKSSVEFLGETYFCYGSSIFPNELRPCYMVYEGYLIVTPAQPAMNRILEVRKGHYGHLSGNPYFQDVERIRERSDHVFVYANLAEVRGVAEQTISGRWKRLWPFLIAITGVDALRAFAYTSGIQKDGFTEAGLLLVDRERQGLVQIYFSQKPEVAEAIEAIPSVSHVVTAGTLPDLSRMWDEVQAQLNQIMEPEQYDRWRNGMNALKSVFQFDIRRDVFNALGTQFAYSQMLYSDGETDSSKTEVLLVLQIQDEGAFRNTVKRFSSLAQLQGGRFVRENYREKSIETVSLSTGKGTYSPSYYFDGSWFYFSTDSSFLKKSIDALVDDKGISSTDDYKKVISGFPSRVNGVSYTNVRAFISTYADMIEKLSENPKYEWLKEYGIQTDLLQLAPVLFGSATYSVIDARGLRIHSFSSIPSGFLLIPSLISYLPSVDTDDLPWDD